MVIVVTTQHQVKYARDGFWPTTHEDGHTIALVFANLPSVLGELIQSFFAVAFRPRLALNYGLRYLFMEYYDIKFMSPITKNAFNLKPSIQPLLSKLSPECRLYFSFAFPLRIFNFVHSPILPQYTEKRKISGSPNLLIEGEKDNIKEGERERE